MLPPRPPRTVHRRIPVQTCVVSAAILILATGCSTLRRAAQNQPCHEATFDVVEIDIARHDIELLWKNADGLPFLTLENARAWLEERGDSLVAITNGGIYEPGFIPTGLLIQNGIEKQPLNLLNGDGNFYLKPNGVFYLANNEGHIVESSLFPLDASDIDLALQSGPLLLQDGKVHPAFRERSQNCRLRSGIGVRADGRIMLAISHGPVNFYTFSRIFLDQLGCKDALFLDGTISSLYAPGIGRMDRSRDRYAGILAIVYKAARE